MNIAFAVVFGVFVIAILVLAFIAIRWAMRRDRLARARQVELHGASAAPPGRPAAPVPTPEERTS